MVSHYADPGAVEALCDHAEGSFPSLVALCAGLKHVQNGPPSRPRKRNKPAPLWLSDAQVESLADAMFASATEPDLVEGLRTARSGLPDGTPSMLMGVSYWFAAHAPLEALTDRVTAEMSWLPAKGFSPELGAEQPNSTAASHDSAHRNWLCDGYDRLCWLTTRYLHNRFGVYDPLWGMFRFIKHSEMSLTIGDTADQVAELRTRFGDHGPSWDMFMGIHDSSQTVVDTADIVAAVEHA